MGTVVYRQLDAIEIVSNADGPALQVRENAWVDAYRRTRRAKPVRLEIDAHFLL